MISGATIWQGAASLAALLLSLNFVACGKKAETAAPEGPPSAVLKPGEGSSPEPAHVVVDASSAEAKAAELTQVVRKYAAEKQRVPKNFQELVSAGYLGALPAAPAGKTFSINKNLDVQLVDQ